MDAFKRCIFVRRPPLFNMPGCWIWCEGQLRESCCDRDGHLQSERDDEGGDRGVPGAQPDAPPSGPARAARAGRLGDRVPGLGGSLLYHWTDSGCGRREVSGAALHKLQLIFHVIVVLSYPQVQFDMLFFE